MAFLIWKNETVLKLIDLYRERPMLWDTNSPYYRDRFKKQEAWRQIGQALGLERALAEKKVRMLVGQFRREQVKAAAAGASRWFAFQPLSFLAGVGPGGAQDASSNSQSHHENEEEEDFIIEERVSSAEPDVAPRRKRPRLEWRPSRGERSDGGDACALLCGRGRGWARDEFHVFGEHVAHKLRKVRDPRALSKTQYLINKILYNAESGKYDKANDRNAACGSAAAAGPGDATGRRVGVWKQQPAAAAAAGGSDAGEPVLIKWETESATSLDSMHSTHADFQY